MKGFGLTTAAASLFVTSVFAAVDPIVISGTKFFYKTNGTQFFIKGVAYQQDVTGNDTSTTTSYSDPLADAAGCKRDIPYLQELQTNTIRVYAIDPTQDHSECMSMLADAGIYVISDLSQPSVSIDRSDPQWNTELLSRYTSVVDALANYTNVLGFFAGNEVSNEPNNTDASAFVKAAVRDTKAYIKQKGYRTIGVGYATNDDADIRVDMADYFNCGNQSDAIDFWGYNVYSWCGDSSYSASGYESRTQELASYSIPAFFAEYGCNQVEPRTFSEVGALFGSKMTPVWSGGIVYMYFQEANDFGLVSVSGNTVTKLTDFNNLSSRIAASATPTGTNSASYTPSNTAQACPTENDIWDAQATPLPPTPDETACACMVDSLLCTVKSGTSDEIVGDLIGQVCGYGAKYCTATTAYGNNATYGTWSMCSAAQILSWDMNAYYLGQDKASTACDFAGNASTKAATTPSSCKSILSAAGTAGTGTISSTPDSTGGSSSSSSTSTKSGSASSLRMPAADWTMLPIGIYGLAAMLVGAAMVAL